MIDKVESFDGNSVLLESGSRIKADILVTARESSAICDTCICPDIWRSANKTFHSKSRLLPCSLKPLKNSALWALLLLLLEHLIVEQAEGRRWRSQGISKESERMRSLLRLKDCCVTCAVGHVVQTNPAFLKPLGVGKRC